MSQIRFSVLSLPEGELERVARAEVPLYRGHLRASCRSRYRGTAENVGASLPSARTWAASRAGISGKVTMSGSWSPRPAVTDHLFHSGNSGTVGIAALTGVNGRGRAGRWSGYVS